MKFFDLPQEKGFTLVELLIVIALIAILSVAVLATINPIEQTNKARDAQFKNDAAEVLSAYERYYASNNQYPWNVTTLADGTSIPSETNGVLVSTSAGFGVVNNGDNPGELVNTSELKSSFSGKVPFQAASGEIDRMYVYTNGIDSNYVCFCPKANVNRSGATSSQLKCLDTAAGRVYDQDDNCVKPEDPSMDGYCTPNANVANVLCVPEGVIGENAPVGAGET